MTTINDSIRDESTRGSLTKRALAATGRGIGQGLLLAGEYGIIKPIGAAYKEIKRRRYSVKAQEFVVRLNYKYDLVKGGFELDLLLTYINNEDNPVKVFKEKPHLFARGASIQGPRTRQYFRWPFQHPIRVETYPISINAPPVEDTMIFHGFPIPFLVDTKVIYQKHPIMFPLRNAGRIFESPDWEQEFHEILFSETGQIIHEHFKRYSSRFPEVVVNDIDPLRTSTRSTNLFDKYGVINLELKIEKFRPKHGQEDLMREIYATSVFSGQASERNVTSFIDAVEKLDALVRSGRISENSFSLISAYINYIKSLRPQIPETRRIPAYISPQDTQAEVVE